MGYDTKTILIIEDEVDICELLKFNLNKMGYTTIIAFNGEEGLKKAREKKPHLILLDLMLPGIHGLNVAKKIKTDIDTKNIFIIMITALGQEDDIIKGLETGADDYVTKPFSFNVLKARINSVLRRKYYNPDMQNIINIFGITINSITRDVRVDNNKIELTFTEFQLLHHLCSHPGWVFTRYQIINKIKGDNYPVTDRSVDFQVVGLRKKLGKKGKLIETIRGVGYRFHPDET
tara:strand:- start:5222 stop:5920 length:699 start_codon:yes stop_codon:yes gene_type:complete